MSPYSIPPLISSVLFLSLGIFCYFKNRKSKINLSFALMCFTIFWWQGTWTILFNTKDPKIASILVKVGYSGIIFLPVTLYHFIVEFLRRNKEKALVWLSYAIGTGFLLSLWATNLFTRGYYMFYWGYYPKVSFVLHPIYLAILTAQVLRILYLLFMYYKKPYIESIKRNQIKYMFWGIFFYTFAAADFADNYGLEFYPLGFIPVLIFIAILAYTIVTYRLMDVNIAIRKIISNLALIILIGGIIVCLYVSPLKSMIKYIGAFIFALLLSLYLPRIKFLLEGFINRILFGSKYDYQETLAEISDTVPTIIDLNKLLKYVTDKTCRSMGLSKGAILLKDDFGSKYSIQYQHGFDEKKLSFMKLESQGPLVLRIKNIEDVLVRHEMIQILNEKDYNDLSADLDKFDAEVVVPIRKGDNVLGLLTLSDKAGGDTFGQEDFRLLHIIAIQAAVAIENIRLYNKLIHTDRQTFLETLASGVSHEMRNRLVAIRTFIDLFPERVQKEHVEQGYYEFRDLAAREMERLTKIIDGLLSYSRAVGKGGEELNINALIEESILIIDPKLKDKDIKLTKNLDKNVTSIKGDKGRLLQVFINIMQNGIEAMNKGRGLAITTVEKDNEIEISISDTGKGIDKEHLDAIFEPFFTTKHNGTGLGLSIVQRIVRDHNGNIKVESELGKGTTFFVSFQKGIEYKPEEIKAKEKLGYWEVKKESENHETSG